MTRKTTIDTQDQAVVVVVRPDGETGVLINPRFGLQPEGVAKVLHQIADRMTAEASSADHLS